MNDRQVLSARIPQPTRETLAAEYRDCRMTGDVPGADAVALRAFRDRLPDAPHVPDRADMLRPVDMLTGAKRSYPMTEAEFARWSADQDRRWDRWLERPGAVRPPRYDGDGRRLAGF